MSCRIRSIDPVKGSLSPDESGERLPLTGSMDLIRQDINNYQESGLDYLVASMSGNSINNVIESVNLFGSEFID